MTANNSNDAPIEHVIKRMSLSHIHPNKYNPNSMSETDFKELVQEVLHLRRVAKPVVVRPDPDHDGEFMIVDGEHNYRAACEAGLEYVLCEIIDVDEVEARIQTYKRNQHGEHDRLREGLMFAEVIESEQVSQRKLAERLNEGEWKIRRSMMYVKAYRQHVEYLIARSSGESLGDGQDSELRESIGQLSPARIEDYLRLPPIIRDEWLRASAPPFVSKKLRAYDAVAAGEFAVALHRVADNGLAEAVFASADTFEFGECVQWLLEADRWMQKRTTVERLAEYVRGCAEWRLGDEFLTLLPIRFSGKVGEVVFSVETWAGFVRNACGACEDDSERYALISARSKEWLRANGIGLGEIATPRTAMLLTELESAPVEIRDAEFLTLAEQIGLFRLVESTQDEQHWRALTVVLDHVRERRAATTKNSDGASGDACSDPVSLYRELIQELECDAEIATEDALFTDLDGMRQFLREWLQESEDLSAKTIEGRPAAEVLAERVETLAQPELVLIRAAVAAETFVSIEQRWYDAVVAAGSGTTPNAAG
jgi:ParB/RepB/Spo0J family partition protein